MTDGLPEFAAALADRYDIEREIGRGGMSTVYAARDLKHDREVAVKVLREDLAVTIGADRFLREIGIAARLQHPHVLPLLDSGTAAGRLYYVMPFVRGQSLRERLSTSGRLDVPTAVHILLDAADALRYAHEQGFVHRDVKPENIMLSGRHALVMDFGVARALSRPEGDGLTTTVGVALGTPVYIAPEQAAADPSVDHRADLYSLGVVGYEMLAGRPPFSASTTQGLLAAHLTEKPEPLGNLRPDIPQPLESAIMRCLAKRPGERWQSAADLINAFEPFALPSGGTTPVASVAVTRARRRRLLLGAVAAVALISVFALTSRASGGGLEPGQTTQLTFDAGLEVDPVPSPDGRMLAFAAGPNGAMRIRVRQAGEGNTIAVAPDLEGNQRSPRWSPDGQRLVFSAGGSIYSVPSLGGTPRLLLEGTAEDPVGDPTFSPDGTRLAYTRGGKIEMMAVDGGPPELLAAEEQQPAHSLAWSPDGRWIAYVAGNRDFALGETLLGNVAPAVVTLVPVDGGDPVPVTEAGVLSVSPAWLPDSRSLLYVSDRGGVRDIWLQRLGRSGRPSGNPTRLTTGLNAHGVSVSGDGRRISYSVFSQQSNVWSVELPTSAPTSSRDAVPVTTGNQVVEDMDVLPGGRWLLFDSNRGGNQDLYLMPLPDGDPFQLTNDPADDFGPAWSPDGREIAFYSLRGGTRDIFVMSNDGRRVDTVTTDADHDHQPRWSPDGMALVFNRGEHGRPHTPWIVSRQADSSWSAPHQLTSEHGVAAAWAPDGRWIAFVTGDGELVLIAPDGSGRRALASPGTIGGGVLKRPVWLDADTVLIRQELPGGLGGFWAVPVAGGAPRLFVRLDDPGRPVFRDDYTTDGERLYFPVSVLESDLWSMELLEEGG